MPDRLLLSHLPRRNRHLLAMSPEPRCFREDLHRLGRTSWSIEAPAERCDSNSIRLSLAERNIIACIQQKKNRKSKTPYDWHLYKKRHLI
ncbi:hypothetical protein [Gluconobacter sp. OJB]|uniref:hypothetical protein n=1 Tax=Gluconobacter sp. OJB TaxID=3145196 RepID=UPI0031F91FF1